MLQLSISYASSSDASRLLEIHVAAVHQKIVENPEIAGVMSKLKSDEPTLTLVEMVQAASIASLLGGSIADVNLNYETGFITEQIARRGISVISSIPQQYPGLSEFMINMLEIGLSLHYGLSSIYDSVYQSFGMAGFGGAMPD